MKKNIKTKNLNIICPKLHLTKEGRKLKFSSHGAKTSSEESVKHHTEKQQDSSESSDDNKKKKKYKSYEEISRELKKLNHLCLTVRLRKEKR